MKNAKHFENANPVVQAQRFELVDRHGKIRATLGFVDDLTSLTFYNHKGERSFTLHEEYRGSVEMRFYAYGKAKVRLGKFCDDYELDFDRSGIMKRVCLADSK